MSSVLDHLTLYSAEVVTLETVSVLTGSYVPDKSFLISRLSLPGERSSLRKSSSSNLYLS